MIGLCTLAYIVVWIATMGAVVEQDENYEDGFWLGLFWPVYFIFKIGRLIGRL